jgi:putative transposase
LLAERVITVSYESFRLCCNTIGLEYAARQKKRHQGFGDTFYIDEVFVKIGGKQQCLWRAVDQDGKVVDIFLQARRDGSAAKHFIRRLLKNLRGEPRKLVTDRLRSYGVAHSELMPETIHVTLHYANNRAGHSHRPTRVQERGMRCFKPTRQAQHFSGVHAAVYNLFNPGRHLV